MSQLAQGETVLSVGVVRMEPDLCNFLQNIGIQSKYYMAQ
jgi:hypothetical protein